MTRYTSEQVQEIVEDWEGKYNKLEEEYSFLKEEYGELEEVCQDLKKENNTLKRKCESYEKANQSVLSIYNEDLEKMKGLQELNSELVKSCKKANRDFFIIAAFLAATLVMMLGMLIR